MHLGNCLFLILVLLRPVYRAQSAEDTLLIAFHRRFGKAHLQFHRLIIEHALHTVVKGFLLRCLGGRPGFPTRHRFGVKHTEHLVPVSRKRGVGIGGDGTFRGLLTLADKGLSVIGIPGTIDNDIACTSYTIGYDTACNTALESIDRLRDTMQSHERCSVVEVMGHRAGHLALNVGISCGATAVLVPEKKVDYERDVIEPIRRARLGGRTHFMIIVAEGVGSAYQVAEKIMEATSLDTRVTVLGHVQRGGSPTARDRTVAAYMGYEAVRLLAAGKTCRVVALQGDTYVDYDITEALSMKKGLDEQTYTLMRALTGVQE